MKFNVITLFPEFFESPLSAGLMGKALDSALVEVSLIDLRAYGEGRHKTTDDTPFGGGAGMVMKPGPVVEAIEAVRATDPETKVVLLTPQGEVFSHGRARALSRERSLTFVCGRYEGFDERIRSFVDFELSIGDFVLMGGEVAALTIMEAAARFVPGVLGDSSSTEEESHSIGLLEYPHYTRPREFRGMGVPEVLLSGNHAEIEKWRRARAVERTAKSRPDLLEMADLSAEELKAIEGGAKNE
ncbi:MAG: tRNA (guanosine(37)-N1)-methyltransferase TrmD [Deltaproteobacteria bacterium]|nr:MAG: tRNA (guanosine(37)-N1)-methyltransferase TrmD [Deltaproteobacteria bacterium]